MRRGKRKLKSKTRLVFFILLLVGLFTGGFVAANNYLWPLIAGNIPVPGIIQELGDKAELAKLDGMNVLMMGVDERENDDAPRTDTMILANINNKDNRIALLSIPRDTKVRIPGYGVNKINAANVLGGPEMAKDVVAEITGMPVDYYITTNFSGFKGIVDALGGVTVDVEKNMYHTERAYGGAYNINLKKGVQQLDGDQALMYARYRNDALGDITRTQRQLKLLTAIGEEAMQPSTITKLTRLIPEVYKNVETDMGMKQMMAMAKAAKNIENVQLVSQTLPGWFLDENGASYWYVDPSKAKEVTTALFRDGKVVDVVLGEMDQDNGKQQMAMETASTGNKATAGNKTSTSKNINNNNNSTGDQAATGSKAATGTGGIDLANPPSGSDSGSEQAKQGNTTGDELGDDAPGFDTMPPPGYYPRPEAVTPVPDPVGQQVQIIINP